jgi:mannose/fructose-specific phosphotransferase system component IIA
VIQGLIIGHGAIGEGLESAIRTITGTCDGITYISNIGLSTADIAEEVRSFTREHDCSDGVIIFIDLFGGSCWQGAKLANTPDTHIVTGVNLPMLLSFMNKRSIHAFDDLPGILDTDGKRGIQAG